NGFDELVLGRVGLHTGHLNRAGNGVARVPARLSEQLWSRVHDDDRPAVGTLVKSGCERGGRATRTSSDLDDAPVLRGQQLPHESLGFWCGELIRVTKLPDARVPVDVV